MTLAQKNQSAYFPYDGLTLYPQLQKQLYPSFIEAEGEFERAGYAITLPYYCLFPTRRI